VRFRIGIADYGTCWGGLAFDMPGCAANAGSRDDLLAVMPVTIAEHVAWLQRHCLPAEPDGPCALNVVEGEFCFDDDLRGVTDDDVEAVFRVMACSRADLLAAPRGVPDAILDWRPPRSAMAQIDEWKPQPLTIREILADVASAESYYRTALHDGRGTPDEGGADLNTERSRLVDALRALSAVDRARRFEPIRSWQSAPEHWTARKVIRRVISHERFHTAEIRQRLSWLLVGVPHFRRE
jgi:hypothetical protein